MKVSGKHYRSVWMEDSTVYMIDQNQLPFSFSIYHSDSHTNTCKAIVNMTTRGAGAIGAVAGFAMAQACLTYELYFENDFSKYQTLILAARQEIEATRPTARNLFYATELVYLAGLVNPTSAFRKAQELAEQNLTDAIKIGEFGSKLLKDGARILTHCNAGWLAFVDYGSALAPIYTANGEGKKLFVYADETRPRMQGARLTAWELYNEDIPHTIVADNSAAYLMAKGMIDIVITGADRIAANGDTANKIGTYEKAILAKEFGIPFYIAAPLSTFDMSISDGSKIEIEERNSSEIFKVQGLDEKGDMQTVLITSPGSSAYNPAFDVTPSRYIAGIITEKGVIEATESEIRKIFN